MIDIALFPIPNCVMFPGMVFPLHVFEPRYRSMVHYCLDTATPIGICHTQKVLRPAKSEQTPEEALHTNQATYKPHSIFSAGPCRLVETLPDGRMRIDVHIRGRFEAVRELQTLPFQIYSCSEYHDQPESLDAAAEGAELQAKVFNRLRTLTAAIPDIQASLAAEDWLEKSPQRFSFEVFRFINFKADLQQEILESRSPTERLAMVLDILNRAA